MIDKDAMGRVTADGVAQLKKELDVTRKIVLILAGLTEKERNRVLAFFKDKYIDNPED